MPLRASLSRLQPSLRYAAHARPCRRAYSTPPGGEKSMHARWYADMVPGMIPVAILGSAVYLGLQLTQASLSHEKYLDEARARVKELEAEVDALQRERAARMDSDFSGPKENGRSSSPDGKQWGWVWRWPSK